MCKAVSPFGIWGESFACGLTRTMRKIQSNYFLLRNLGESLFLYTYLHVQSHFPHRNLGEPFACRHVCNAEDSSYFPLRNFGERAFACRPTRAKLFSPFGTLGKESLRVSACRPTRTTRNIASNQVIRFTSPGSVCTCGRPPGTCIFYYRKGWIEAASASQSRNVILDKLARVLWKMLYPQSDTRLLLRTTWQLTH